MIIVNRHTRKKRQMEYADFRKEFAKDIKNAFDSFRHTELAKPFYNYKDDNSMEFNFYNKNILKNILLILLYLRWFTYSFYPKNEAFLSNIVQII